MDKFSLGFNIYRLLWQVIMRAGFDCHIKNICNKAVQQLNILKRIGINLKKAEDRELNPAEHLSVYLPMC
jgi:hypothetical protein